jgi:hypothetical protein
MSMRHFKAALLAASVLLLAPQIGLADKYSSTPSRPAYTPTPPKVYTPPARTTTPANNNVRSPSQSPQGANNNSVRPTPRVTVTPRTPQPGRTPANLTRTPSNSNSQAQQVANSNLKQQQQRQLQQKQFQQKQLFTQKQQQQKQFQQKQLFAQKQQQQKLSAQKEAESKARLAKLRVNLGQKGTLTPAFTGAADPSRAGTGDNKPPSTLTEKFNKASGAIPGTTIRREKPVADVRNKSEEAKHRLDTNENKPPKDPPKQDLK